MITLKKYSKDECKDFSPAKRYSYFSDISLYRFLICFSIIMVFLNSIYPKPVMDFLERNGIITYVTFKKTHFDKEKNNNFFSKSEYDYYIRGIYYDSNHKIHSVNISYSFPMSILHYFDEYRPAVEAVEQKNILGAYYNFYPDWEFFREANVASMWIYYGSLFISIFIIIFIHYSKKFLFSNLRIVTFAHPVGYFENERKGNRGSTYEKFLIWNTPEGNIIDKIHNDDYPLDKFTEEIEIDENAVGLYLKDALGRKFFVLPKNVNKVAKKYNIIIDGSNIRF